MLLSIHISAFSGVDVTVSLTVLGAETEAATSLMISLTCILVGTLAGAELSWGRNKRKAKTRTSPNPISIGVFCLEIFLWVRLDSDKKIGFAAFRESCDKFSCSRG